MILVTGGSGFIGSHVLDRLSAAGLPSRALLRRKIALPPGIGPVFGDLASGDGLDQALVGVTAVIHIAGTVKAVRPADYYAGNVTASENLARAVARAERAAGAIPFLQVSSLAAAGPCANEAAVDEATAPAPITHYGKSKLQAEQAVLAHLPGAVIVRPPVVYGPRDRGVFSILQSVRRGIVPQIAGGERWFSCILVDDLVTGMLAALRHPAAAGRAWFLANPEPLTWTSLGELASRIMNRRARILRVPISAAYAMGWFGEMTGRITGTPGFVSREKIREATERRWVCSPARAAAELGIETRTPHLEGFSRTLAWYREAGWLKY